jgi:hypothetical protein
MGVTTNDEHTFEVSGKVVGNAQDVEPDLRLRVPHGAMQRDGLYGE